MLEYNMDQLRLCCILEKRLTIKWTSIIHNWCNFYILRLNDIFISLIWVCCAFDKNIHHVNTHQMKKLPAPHLQMEPHPYIDYILNEFICKLIIYALKILRKLEKSYNVFHAFRHTYYQIVNQQLKNEYRKKDNLLANFQNVCSDQD